MAEEYTEIKVDVEEIRLKELQAEERRKERVLFRKCSHTFEDVTEERRRLVEERGIPGWVERRIEKEMEKPPEKRRSQWLNRITLWKTLKYLKCGSCGLLRVVRKEANS